MSLTATPKGPVWVCPPEMPPLASASDWLDLAASAPTDTIALRREHFVPEFYELRTGLAGDILQRLSNYRRRLVILGDFSAESSRSLNDFIRESNRTGQVVFAPSLEAGVALLR